MLQVSRYCNAVIPHSRSMAFDVVCSEFRVRHAGPPPRQDHHLDHNTISRFLGFIIVIKSTKVQLRPMIGPPAAFQPPDRKFLMRCYETTKHKETFRVLSS